MRGHLQCFMWGWMGRWDGMVIKPAREAFTGRQNSQWEGGRLFDGSAGFFYRNSCNSGTESRKIVPKVGN